MKKLIQVIIFLSSPLFVYYLLVNILLSPHKFSNIFFISDQNVIDISTANLLAINFLFIFQSIYTIFLIIESLFQIRIPTNTSYLDSNNISYYLKINSFYSKNSSDECLETIIFKQKYRKKPTFFLIKVQLTKKTYKEDTIRNNGYYIIEDIPYHKKLYTILDSSQNFSEIVYFFNSINK